MEHPKGFEGHRYIGDKRIQRVYDLDDETMESGIIAELVTSQQFATFGPDTLTEARNRGYRSA